MSNSNLEANEISELKDFEITPEEFSKVIYEKNNMNKL